MAADKCEPQGQQCMQMDAEDQRDGDDVTTNPQLVFTRMTPCLLPELAQVSHGAVSPSKSAEL